MDKIVDIEPVAAVMPCLFCGKRKIINVVTIHSCDERRYENISFTGCMDCLKKIASEINKEIERIETCRIGD